MRGGSGIRAALVHKLTPTKVRRSSFGPTPAGLRDNAQCKVISQSSGGSWSARYAVDVLRVGACSGIIALVGSAAEEDERRELVEETIQPGSHSDCMGGGSSIWVWIGKGCIECALATASRDWSIMTIVGY